MTSISIDDVKKLAQLSALSITDEEAENLSKDLESILQFVEQLNDVDTTGLEPTYQVTGLTNVSRDDDLIDYKVGREELLKNAPDQKDGSLKVKRVLG
jgi:aspartyl-tRNA(Asn)/glutamyl-tRNA(Gln) amidotransferase subunit C